MIHRTFTSLAFGLLGLLSCMGSGCAMTETSTQLAEVAYLTFENNSVGLLLQVDDGDRKAMLTEWNNPTKKKTIRYEITPGRHRVRVWRGDTLLVNRDIFLSRGQTFEVTLP